MAIMVYMVLTTTGLSMAGMPAGQKSGELADQTPQTDQTSSPLAPNIDLTPLFVLLGIVAAALLVSACMVHRIPRQRGGEEKEDLPAQMEMPGDD
jgi:hypothetical protein